MIHCRHVAGVIGELFVRQQDVTRTVGFHCHYCHNLEQKHLFSLSVACLSIMNPYEILGQHADVIFTADLVSARQSHPGRTEKLVDECTSLGDLK